MKGYSQGEKQVIADFEKVFPNAVSVDRQDAAWTAYQRGRVVYSDDPNKLTDWMNAHNVKGAMVASGSKNGTIYAVQKKTKKWPPMKRLS